MKPVPGTLFICTNHNFANAHTNTTQRSTNCKKYICKSPIPYNMWIVSFSFGKFYEKYVLCDIKGFRIFMKMVSSQIKNFVSIFKWHFLQNKNIWINVQSILFVLVLLDRRESAQKKIILDNHFNKCTQTIKMWMLYKSYIRSGKF